MVRYFVAIAHEGSFTRAAGELGISQPALSQQIKRFEALIGVTLLERTTSGPVLTAAGEAMLREGEHLLAAAERALRWTREVAMAVPAERIRLCFIPGTPPLLVTVAVRIIDRLGDTASLELHRVEWADQMECLVSGAADIAFVQLPLMAEGLKAIPLATGVRVAAFPAGHRLAGRRQLSLADLTGEPILDAVHNRDYWIVNPRPDGSVPTIVAPAASTAEEMLALVAAGRAMSITTRSLADAYPRPDVSFVTITDLSPVTYGVAWRATETRPLIQHLVDAIHFELTGGAGAAGAGTDTRLGRR
jgi:molybdate transport repressor ModE-like protein